MSWRARGRVWRLAASRPILSELCTDFLWDDDFAPRLLDLLCGSADPGRHSGARHGSFTGTGRIHAPGDATVIRRATRPGSIDETKRNQLIAEAGQEEAKLSPEQQAQCVLPAESWKAEKMAMSNTDEDRRFSALPDYATICVSIEPQMNTYQDYFFGLTADSVPNSNRQCGRRRLRVARLARAESLPTS